LKKGGGDEEHTDTQIHNHHSHYPRLHTNIRHLQKEERTGSLANVDIFVDCGGVLSLSIHQVYRRLSISNK